MAQRVHNLLLETQLNSCFLITALFSLFSLLRDMSNPAAIVAKEFNTSRKSTKSGAISNATTLTCWMWHIMTQHVSNLLQEENCFDLFRVPFSLLSPLCF